MTPPLDDDPQPGPTRRPGPLFLGAGALVLVLVVAVVAATGGVTSSTGAGLTGAGGAPSGGTSGVEASDAVRGYLRAVARGDAQAAVAYAVDPASVSTTYLTRRVLAASAKAAPLTDLQVGALDPDLTTVPVTYRLGATPVSTSYRVARTGDGRWRLVDVTADLDLTSVRAGSVPLLLNGTRVGPGRVSVLPGSYRLTTGLRNFDYGAGARLVVGSPADVPDLSRVRPQISSTGRRRALAAVEQSWDRCLDRHAQQPKGCPNQLAYRDFDFRDRTVRWSRRGADPFTGLRPLPLDSASPGSTASNSTTLAYDVQRDLVVVGTCTAGGRTGTCAGRLRGGTVRVQARLAGDVVEVDWRV